MAHRLKKTGNNYKAVIFDLGNVLVNYDAKVAAKRFAKDFKVPVFKLWSVFFDSRVEKAYTRGELSSREFHRYVKSKLGIKISFEAFGRYWNEIFFENPGMEVLLEQLSKKYPLYLISNTNALHFNFIQKNYSVLKFFKQTFPSHRMGLRKPDPKIYLEVLRRTRLKPEEAVYIDDTYAFVKGAKKVGLDAIWFKSKARLMRDLRARQIIN